MINNLVQGAILLCLIAGTDVQAGGVNEDKKRTEELRQLMWQSSDKDFDVTKIPDKWKNQSAVIIAKSNVLSYRKAVFISSLSHNRYNHYRIMLLDNTAVEQYAQFNIPGSRNAIEGRYSTYAGFKIIKPDGREIEISLDALVKEEGKLNHSSYENYKLAIPNLEKGDILDYYMAEEQTFLIQGKYYGFDPVIFQLHDEYPVMKQKISFDVLRRCYINLVSLNGAPEFRLTEDATDEKNHYFLEDGDRESVKDVRWLHTYRELPTIKFKVTYASSAAANVIPGFIGSPGKIKSSVSMQEIESLMRYLFTYSGDSYIFLASHMKKNHRKVKDKDKLAREAYYALRNINRVRPAEAWLLRGQEPNPDIGTLRSVAALSKYYKAKKIPHEVFIGIPRQISALDNLILENELTFMIKVNTTTPFCLGRFDNNAIVNEIDPDMQGTQVFSANGLAIPGVWSFKKTDVPVVSHEENKVETMCKLQVTDLAAGNIEADVTKSARGVSRIWFQNALMDIYTYRDEEKAKYTTMTNDFDGYAGREAKKLLQQRVSYKASREENFRKALKALVDDDYEMTIDKTGGLQVHQTGRSDDKPEFKCSYKIAFRDAVKRAGANYIIDIGKFIEKQVQLTDDEKDRKHNIYMPYAQSFSNVIELSVPEGYIVQGADKLNMKVENKTGGFTSTATVEGNLLRIKTYKFYKTNYLEKDAWNEVMQFIQAAHEFTQKQILLKKM